MQVLVSMKLENLIVMECKYKDKCPLYLSDKCESGKRKQRFSKCISYVITAYENEKRKNIEAQWIYHMPVEIYNIFNFNDIEKAIGFRLFSWQKSYILGKGYRKMGRTTAEILHMLLDKNKMDEPIDFSKPPRNKRQQSFRNDFYDVWNKLNSANIKMRKVMWNEKDKISLEL